MTWNAFHRRGDVLRAVCDHADLHRDGHLPFELPGVAETFHDERDLVAALTLRWSMRLQSTLERHLDETTEPTAAVRDAWAETAAALPGIRAILDAQFEHPATPAVADALRRAAAKEQALLARGAQAPVAEVHRVRVPRGSAAFVARLKAALAA